MTIPPEQQAAHTATAAISLAEGSGTVAAPRLFPTFGHRMAAYAGAALALVLILLGH